MAGLAFGFFALFSIVGAAFRSKSLLVIVFLVLYPFLPKYIGVSLGHEALALSFRRVILVSVFIFVLILSFQLKLVRVNRKKSGFLFLYLFTIAIASFRGIGDGNASAVAFRAVENVNVAVVGMFLGKEALSKFGWSGLIRIAFVWPVFIIAPLAVLERLTGYSLFFELFGNNSVAADFGVKAYLVRNEVIRSQTCFGSSVTLAEYLVFSLPGALFLAGQRRERRQAMFLVALIILAILTTGARSGIGFGLSILLLHQFFIALEKRSNVRRSLILVTVSTVILFAFVAIAYKVSTLERVDSFLVFDTDSERSTYSRILQYPVVFETLKDHIFFGLGYSRNFVTDFQFHALDNYYLWVMLESGIVGLVAFVGMIWMGMAPSVTLVRGHADRETVRVGFMLIEFFIAFTLYKFFMQPPANLLYFFLFAGALFSYLGRTQTRQDIVRI